MKIVKLCIFLILTASLLFCQHLRTNHWHWKTATFKNEAETLAQGGIVFLGNSIIEGLNRKKDKRALSYRYLLDLCKEKKLNIKIPDKNVLIWSCFDDRHIEIIKCNNSLFVFTFDFCFHFECNKTLIYKAFIRFFN